MTTVKNLVNCLQGRNPDAQVFLMTQRKQPFENHLAGVVGREEMLDQQWRLELGVGHDDVFLVVGRRIRPGSLSAWIVAEHAQRAAQVDRGDATTSTAWKATLQQIAQQHLRIDTLEVRAEHALDVHRVGVAELSLALAAAYRAGIAGGTRHTVDLDDDEPDGTGSAPEGSSASVRGCESPASSAEAAQIAPGPGDAPSNTPAKVHTSAAEAAKTAETAFVEALASAPAEGLGIASETTEAVSGEALPSESWEGVVIAPEPAETAPGASDND